MPLLVHLAKSSMTSSLTFGEQFPLASLQRKYRFSGLTSLVGTNRPPCLVYLRISLALSDGSSVGLRTTPWIACGPKCFAAAGPPNTNVMFEFMTEYGISFPPPTLYTSLRRRRHAIDSPTLDPSFEIASNSTPRIAQAYRNLCQSDPLLTVDDKANRLRVSVG